MVLAPIANRQSPITNGDPEAPRFFTARESYSSISPVALKVSSLEDLGSTVMGLRYTVAPTN